MAPLLDSSPAPLRIGLAVALAAAALAAGCDSATGPPERPGRLRVVAAESSWGSIAAQLGGEHAQVMSIVADPHTDPHSYEPTAGDARRLAGARLAIVNGIGYDAWASRLLAASPASGRVVLDVGRRLKIGRGGNPHQWYSPTAVHAVVAAITSAYDRLDPADAAYFDARRTAFLTRGLARYDALLARIRAAYAGLPVGYSESIFQPLGEYLRLRLLTPHGFARAIAEGGEVTATDKRTVDAQVRSGAIRVWVYNRQNATPDVRRVNGLVAARHIPLVSITETLDPATASFQQWQSAQLQSLLAALALGGSRR